MAGIVFVKGVLYLLTVSTQILVIFAVIKEQQILRKTQTNHAEKQQSHVPTFVNSVVVAKNFAPQLTKQIFGGWQVGGFSPWGAKKPNKQIPVPAVPVVSTGNSEKKPLECNVRRYDNVYFYGTLSAMVKHVPNLETCVASCWQLRELKRCASVNYLSRQRKCEIMEDQLPKSPNMKILPYIVEDMQGATYVIPVACNAPGFNKSTSALAPSVSTNGGSAGPGCGRTFVEPRISKDIMSGRSSPRIVGGTEARPHSFPWLVSLQAGYDHYCGGALIRVSDKRDETDIVVTASHCLYDKPYDLHVVAGAHSLGSAASGKQRIAAEKYIMHPEYVHEITDNDIGIVKLKTPVKFSQQIQPICLPAHGEPVKEGLTAIVAGWGAMAENAFFLPDVLMQVPVIVQSYNDCDKKYYPGEMIAPHMFCAGHLIGGRDSCQGDSGGPLVFKTDGGWMLRGVVSFGEGCARENKPGVYANVSFYVPWIREIVSKISSIH